MRSILIFLAEVSVSAGIIWAATMTLKRTLRGHLSPRAHLAVWLVLIARLVLPVTFETGLHFSWLPQIQHADGTETDAETFATRRIPGDDAFAAPAASSPRPAAVLAKDDAHTEADTSSALPEGIPQSGSFLSLEADPSEIAVSVWIVGMLLGTVLSVRGYDRLRRDVRSRMVPGSDPLHHLFQECLAEAGIRSRVALAVQDKLAGPALMYPNIVLVPDTMHAMGSETAKMAMRHELTHFVRRDHL